MADRHDGSSELTWSMVTLAMGAVIGAAAALLLAPKAGQELRTHVLGAGGSWKEHAAETLAQGRERVISAVEQNRHQAGGSGAGPVRPS